MSQSELSLAGVLVLVALVVGATAGARLAPRTLERRQRVAVEAAGITVAQMLERIVALMPLGTAASAASREAMIVRYARALAWGARIEW